MEAVATPFTLFGLPGALLAVLVIAALIFLVKQRGHKNQTIPEALTSFLHQLLGQKEPLDSNEAFYGPSHLQKVVIHQSDNPKGLIIQVHGGGWNGGDLSDDAPQAQALCDDGWTVLNINYRLAPAAKYPAPVDDVAAVVKAAKNGGGDNCTNPALWAVASQAAARKIVLVGNSAGGHLAHLAALRPGSPVDRVVSIAAPLDLRDSSLYVYPDLLDALIADFAGDIDRAAISPGVIPVTGEKPKRIAYLANEDTIVPPTSYIFLQPNIQVTYVAGLDRPITSPSHALTQAQSISLAIQGVNAAL